MYDEKLFGILTKFLVIHWVNFPISNCTLWPCLCLDAPGAGPPKDCITVRRFKSHTTSSPCCHPCSQCHSHTKSYFTNAFSCLQQWLCSVHYFVYMFSSRLCSCSLHSPPNPSCTIWPKLLWCQWNNFNFFPVHLSLCPWYHLTLLSITSFCLPLTLPFVLFCALSPSRWWCT